jgi:hypothetical protein
MVNGKQSVDLSWKIPSISGRMEVRKSGMIFSGKLNFRDWESIGERLFSMADSTAWWIADWLLFGESAFMDRYEEAIRRTSLSYQTLRNYAWVARQFELSRRRDKLSFGHHAEVAALPIPEQDFWLRKTEEHNWSRNRLRAEVRNSLHGRRSDGSRDSSGQAQAAQDSRSESNQEETMLEQAMDGVRSNGIAEDFTLHLNGDVLAQCFSAAQRQGLRVDQWAVRVLTAAALSSV